MARSRSSKRPASVQAELKAFLLQKRADLVAKLREEREGRVEATARREKIEGMPFGDRPALSPDDEMGFAVADRRAGPHEAPHEQVEIPTARRRSGRGEIESQPERDVAPDKGERVGLGG